MTSDLERLEAWRGGDREAGRELLERHYEPLARFFRNKVGVDAPELVQRTMLACIESRDRFRGTASFRTYLFTIARNELCAHFRRSGREVDLGERSIADLGTSPSAALGRRQEQRLLLEALRRVSIDAQITLELYYWEGLDTREIAEVLGIPAATVRSRLRLARDAVEAQLAALSLSRKVLGSTVEGFERWMRSMQARLPER
jgi:RNA polymerase sigma-70 factor (ECF subfamily)